MNKRHYFYVLPVILLLIVVIAGWFVTDYLGNEARKTIIEESRAAALTLSTHVSSTFTHIEGAVQSLAGSPWIAPALLSKGAQDIEHANSVLDRYNFALNASVSYLMDTDGMTVASSNRNDPDSFVGKSYHFRPYFQEAAEGRPYRYFALGVISGKRGFYASYPVRNRPSEVVGVVTMKKDLDEIETFFSGYPFCFFISPDGIILLSSTPSMVLKSLWPLDKAVRDTLIASQQFGNILSEDVFKKEIVDGTEVTLEGNDYFVSRKVIGSDGWSIVLLTPTDRIWIYELIGIVVTISICLLILIFSGIIYLTDRSKEAIRQSEESKRLLLHASGEGILGVDAIGQTTFVNSSAMRMLGFAEEEMLGQSIHALIHHHHADGSNYPVEDCPMDASYAKAVENHITDEVLWRKDGSYFPVEYSSTPIIKDGKTMGAVVTFRDITERKRTEEALRESESRMRAITDSARDAILMMGPESRISYWNPAAERILGYTSAEAIGQNLHQLIAPPRYHEAHHATLLLFQQKGQGAAVGKTLDLEAIRKDGKEISVQLSLSAIHMKGAWHAVGFLRDVTEQKQAEEKIQQMAYHDSLTGLPNRELFFDRLGVALTQAQRNEKGIAVTMLDLDNFKGVNDSLGHDVGDLLLKAAAERLRAVLRKGDTVARFGGDEFILILPDLKAAEDAIQVARKIVDGFRKPFLVDTHQLTVTTSIGIAVYPHDGKDESTLLKNADIAMYQAKQAGLDRYQLCNKA